MVVVRDFSTTLEMTLKKPRVFLPEVFLLSFLKYTLTSLFGGRRSYIDRHPKPTSEVHRICNCRICF